MKSIVLSILTALLILNVNAQVVPNPSFEDWTPSGSEPPFDWEEPTDWKSNNAAIEFITAVVNQTDDSFEGSSAARIHTQLIFGDTIPGLMVNGDPSVDFANYSVNFNEAGNSLDGVPDLPLVFEGAYKFASTSEEDLAYAVVMLTKFNTETNQLDTTAFGSIDLSQVDEYTSFEINVVDLGTDVDPDNLIIAFFSTNPDNRLIGGVLLVDDIGFVSSTDDILAIDEQKSQVTLFPNPVSMQLQMVLKTLTADKTIQIFSVQGQQLMSFKTSLNVESIDMSHFDKGVYFVKVLDGKGQLIETQRITKL